MVIKLFHRHSLLVCIGLLAGVVALCMAVNFFGNQEDVPAQAPILPSSSFSDGQADSSVPEIPVEPASEDEMRAVWVPYMSLDMSQESDRSEAAFQQKFDAIVEEAKQCGMNALVVHVRPFGDALYPSNYFPWSHIVGGTQGTDPGYDPLEYMVEATHKAGMEFHAWINPLRIQSGGDTPSTLAADNNYTVWHQDASRDGWTVQTATGKYYNPAYSGVRKLIADGVKEIVENYAVDGIQFDDYFYPSEDPAFDEGAYNAYVESVSRSGKPLELLEWRQANINAMVSLTYSEIKSVNPDVQFGISPQVNVSNDLKMGADVESWCSVRGYVDYICPQLYVNFENPVLPYDVAAEQWREMTTDPNVKLYFGLAVYKAGSDADGGTWKKADNILAQQVALWRQVKCDGFMFYSCEYLDHDQTRKEMENVMKQFAG